jgi:hypothetical protein
VRSVREFYNYEVSPLKKPCPSVTIGTEAELENTAEASAIEIRANIPNYRS